MQDLPPTRPSSLSKQPSLAHVNLNHIQRLRHQPSKLDLIDDTTLTSLPLPPPPAKTKQRALSLDTTSLRSESPPVGGALAEDPHISEVDDTFEESEDPIVLVEDYMNKDISLGPQKNPPDPPFLHHMDRKQLLANFKLRLQNKNFNFGDGPSSGFSLSAPAVPTISNKRAISEEFVPQRPLPGSLSTVENWEAIFGRIPGSDQLKHCDLCEKPLYEISSLINDTNENHDPRQLQTSKNRHSLNHIYTEFICWDCIEAYEDFFNELYENELETNQQQTTSDSSVSTEKLVGIFQSIKDKYDAPGQPPKKISKKTSFSDHLMDKLHYLNNMSTSFSFNLASLRAPTPHKVDSQWVRNLQQKLRWRWRFQGLIPLPFSEQNRKVA